MARHTKVAIIGGGLAGIGAARALNKAGASDFLLIEAQDRLGGRIYTRTYGDGIIDIGAQFIHGKVGNPIYKFAAEVNNVDEDYNSDSSSSSDDWNPFNGYFTSDGKRIDPSLVKEVMDFLETVLEDCNQFGREGRPNMNNDSLGTFLHRQFEEYLASKDDTEDVRRQKNGIFNWKLLVENVDNACRSIYEMSLHGWGKYVEFEGAVAIPLKRGYRPVLEHLLKDVPTERILMNTRAKFIDWRDQDTETDRKPIAIHTGDGSVITADHVITTISVGCLKRHAQSMFRPLLPNAKISAIHHIGFGTVNKIFLEFSEPFWEDNDCDIQFAWTDETFVLNCASNPDIKQHLQLDWYRALHGFDSLPGHDNLLLGWLAGEQAQVMETIPDQIIVDVCHELLMRFTGRTDLPRPTAITRSTWYSDPYSCGSYSYIKDGYAADECLILADPLPDEKIALTGPSKDDVFSVSKRYRADAV